MAAHAGRRAGDVHARTRPRRTPERSRSLELKEGAPLRGAWRAVKARPTNVNRRPQIANDMKSGFVSFLGRPNAGKSTLLNRLVGQKLAIVSDKPQTTRTRILGVRNYPDAQVIFLDTPGIHRPLHRMNVRMVDTALDTMREVDVLGLVLDATEPAGQGDRYVFDLVRDVRAPVFLILNKIDLLRKSRLLPMIEQFSHQGPFAEIVPISA